MKDLGELHYCLGLEVWRDPSKIVITQRKYTRELLKRSNMNYCKEFYLPLEHNAKLCSDDGTKEMDGTLYCYLVGSLKYLTTTRPSITYSINTLS